MSCKLSWTQNFKNSDTAKLFGKLAFLLTIYPSHSTFMQLCEFELLSQFFIFREQAFLEVQLNSNLSITLTAAIVLEILALSNSLADIYPSSFINVRFWKKIEFSNVAKCWWRSGGAISSAPLHGEDLVGLQGGKFPEKLWSFYIWRTNK